MFAYCIYNYTKTSTNKTLQLYFESLGGRMIEVPSVSPILIRTYPSDIHTLESIRDTTQGPGEFEFHYYEDSQVEEQLDPHGEHYNPPRYKLKTGAIENTDGYGSIVSTDVTSVGAEWFSGNAEDFASYMELDTTLVPGSVWQDEVTGDMLQWTGSRWVPYPGGGGATVDFQYSKVPMPSKLANKVIQYIGLSSECYREDDPDDPRSGELDPDIGVSAFRGDWIHSYKDPETGEWHWEILMHNGQIIEVDALKESNFQPKAEFLGYRIYLTKPYEEELLYPDGTSYNPKRYQHRTRGWYQVAEKLKSDGSSYNPKAYEWIHVLDEWVTMVGSVKTQRAHVKQFDRYYPDKPYTWWIVDYLDVITEEDQCTVKFKAHYSEAMQKRLDADHDLDPAPAGQPENPLAKNREYQHILLEDVPLPVPASKKTYDIGTQAVYMSANLEVELTDDGQPYIANDSTYGKVFIPPTASSIGEGVLGIDWSRVEITTGDHKFTKAYTLKYDASDPTKIVDDISTIRKARYQNIFRNEPKGILKIPDGAIPVDSIDITLTYDYDNRNMGPQDVY